MVNISFDKRSQLKDISNCEEEYIKYKNIMDVMSIKTADAVNIFLALKYFCSTQVGLSRKKAIRFQNPRNNQTSNADFSCNQKKNTNVKWKHIQTTDDVNP